jgi:hypothetical protein
MTVGNLFIIIIICVFSAIIMIYRKTQGSPWKQLADDKRAVVQAYIEAVYSCGMVIGFSLYLLITYWDFVLF